jgi:hypothetical protein
MVKTYLSRIMQINNIQMKCRSSNVIFGPYKTLIKTESKSKTILGQQKIVEPEV